MADAHQQDPPRILNSLTFAQEQMNFILGHSLASLYQDVLAAPLSPDLQALVNQLPDQPSSASQSHHAVEGTVRTKDNGPVLL